MSKRGVEKRRELSLCFGDEIAIERLNLCAFELFAPLLFPGTSLDFASSERVFVNLISTTSIQDQETKNQGQRVWGTSENPLAR